MKLFTCCYSKKTYDDIKIDDIHLEKCTTLDDNEHELEKNIKYSDTISFVPPIKGGRVIKVYDGDTITIAARLPYKESPLYRFHVRLNGIDTPEIKGSTDDEKIAAKSAKEYVEKLTLNKYVTLENVATEKFGRVLADVYVGEMNICENLLKEKYAVKYNGGKKVFPVSWLKYKVTGEMD